MNTLELRVKLSNCFATSPTSPPLSHSEENVKPQCKNDSQLGGLQEECNERQAQAGNGLLLHHLLQKISITEAITPSGEKNTTPAVCWNPVEPQQSARLTSHHAALQNLLISFRSELWAHIAICGCKRVTTHTLIDCISLCVLHQTFACQ